MFIAIILNIHFTTLGHFVFLQYKFAQLTQIYETMLTLLNTYSQYKYIIYNIHISAVHMHTQMSGYCENYCIAIS